MALGLDELVDCWTLLDEERVDGQVTGLACRCFKGS
jgi:hypothetical protein